MKVSIRLFAGLHDLLGERNVAIELTEGANISDLRMRLAEEYPVVAPYLTTLVCAVDEEYVTSEHELADGDEVALIPPVSGGSDDQIGPIKVTRDPLVVEGLIASVRKDESGAVAVFSGVARNNSEGRKVIALEYDAYPSMAERKMREVAGEVAERWPQLTGVSIHHRVGRLTIGETSLLVAVSSGHRAEAFEACHYAVDRIKQVVPIWKKEIWETGEGQWARGHTVDLPEPARPASR